MSKAFHIEKYTLPIAASLEVREEWQVSITKAKDPEFVFTRSRQRAYRAEDSFEARKAFLAVKTIDEALRFFEYYGPLQYKKPREGGSKKDRSLEPETVRWSQFLSVQADFHLALMAEGIPSERAALYRFVFGQPLIVEVGFRAVQPDTNLRGARTDEIDDAAITPCFDVIDALRATIFLSRRQGFRWRRCARPDCANLFEHTTKHQRLYCSPECAHLQAVRSYNASHKPGAKKSSKRRSKSKPKKGK
jgi:hypothetical protein